MLYKREDSKVAVFYYGGGGGGRVGVGGKIITYAFVDNNSFQLSI